MAVINRTFNYLFLAEPYCASRAIEQALLTQQGSQRVDQWIHESFRRLVDIGELMPHEPILKFSVVRHPADWAVTSYHHMTGWHGRGFIPYIEYQLDNNVWDETCFIHANMVDLNLRYEQLEAHLNDVLDARDAPTVTLKRVGVTQGKKHWREYWPDTLYDRFKSQLKDFERYGYQ